MSPPLGLILFDRTVERGDRLVKCHYCPKDALYKCSVCGQLLCGEHAQLRTICPECIKETKLECTIEQTSSEDKKKEIREFVRRFWGEEEQLTFDREFKVTELLGYVAKLRDKVVGFVSTAEVDEAVIIVALGVLPRYQGSGIGKRLVEEVEKEAVRRKKKKLLVSTSNDDLPALAFYQTVGFQIYEVKPNVIAEKHGKVLAGIGKLPIRDELRLQKKLGVH
jgi:ribosomal protein S18 acetylase RimI-like enzyme